jgi:AraC family transcriptional regulator
MRRSMATRHIDADVAIPLGHVRVERASWAEPIDSVGTPEQHHLELALLPHSRAARGCFPDRWGPRRFERIGAMFFLPARHTVHARSECHVQSSIVCAFRPDAIREWLDDDLEWTDGRLRGSLDLANPAIRRLVLHLGEEARSPGFASDALIELIAGQIAIELGRHFQGVCGREPSGGLAPWRLRLIDERLATAGDCPSLSELSTACGLSVRQLARAFRASRGRSIGAYLAAHRVEQARQMLAGERSIKAIAHSAGFASPSSFTAAFRRATGETPFSFRRRASRRDRLH